MLPSPSPNRSLLQHRPCTPPCRTLQLNPFPTLTSLLLPHMRFPRPQVNRTHSNPSQTLGRLLNHQRRHTSRPKRHIPHLNRSDNHQCRTHRLRPWKLPPHHRSTWPRTLRPHPPDRYPISPSNPAHPPVQPATPRHHPSLQRPPPRPHRRKPRHRSTSPTLRLRHNSRSTRHPRSSLRLSTSTAPTRSRKPQLPSSQTRPRPSPRVWRNRNAKRLSSLSYKRAGLEASRAKGERDHLYIDDADTGVNDRSVFVKNDLVVVAGESRGARE
jgi:hypothetical protein